MATNLFQEAYITGKPIAVRMQVHVILAWNSYELCSEQMKTWMHNSCTKLLDSVHGTMLMVIFDIAKIMHAWSSDRHRVTILSNGTASMLDNAGQMAQICHQM